MNKLFACLSLLVTLTTCVKPSVSCFTFSPSVIKAGDTVVFDASCSQYTYQYRWSFGDGSDTILLIPMITHAFGTAGRYTVMLKAERKDGIPLRKGKPVEQHIINVN